MRTSIDQYDQGILSNGYDYKNQAWVKDGKYVRCGHPESMRCRCFGRLHEGEPVKKNEKNSGVVIQAIIEKSTFLDKFIIEFVEFERKISITPSLDRIYDRVKEYFKGQPHVKVGRGGHHIWFALADCDFDRVALIEERQGE